MGAEYNELGEVCESSKQAKGEEIHMGSYNNFAQSLFVHEEKERELRVGAAMEGEF